jgi:hypothetical protein
MLLQISQPLQPPSPTPSKSTQAQQNHSNADTDKATKPSHAASAPDVGEKRTADEGRKSENTTPSNWWLIIPTIAIAVATVVQVWIYQKQTGYMAKGLRISIRQARIATRNTAAAKVASEAAQISARAAKDALLIQRAFIQVSSMGFAAGNIGLPDGAPPTGDTSVRICVKNHEATRGVNFAVRASLSIFPGNKSTMLSPAVLYDIPPESEIGITFDAFSHWLDDDAIAVLKQGRTSFEFSLNGSYADIFGGDHELHVEGTLPNWMHRGWEIRTLQNT